MLLIVGAGVSAGDTGQPPFFSIPGLGQEQFKAATPEPVQTCASPQIASSGIEAIAGDEGLFYCEKDFTKSLDTPIYPPPSSCNGQVGSHRQARVEFEGQNGNYQFFRVFMDCLPTTSPGWTFLEMYDPFTGNYLGSMGQNDDSVGYFVEVPNTARVKFIVKNYDSFDPSTGTYGNLTAQDEIERFTNLLNPELAYDTDRGDDPSMEGWCDFDDWFGYVRWPDYYDHDTYMVEQYLVCDDDDFCPAHVMDITDVGEVFVNGVPAVSFYQWPAEGTRLFADGFESGDFRPWSNHTE